MGHHHHHHSLTDVNHQNQKRLSWVLGMIVVYMVVEAVGGWLTGSLALLADAGHMLADAAGLGLALFALKLAAKPATPAHTYGYYRAEILVSLLNAVLLLGISIYILYEAYHRFLEPPPIASKEMLVIATIGFLVNVAGLFIIKQGVVDALNMRMVVLELMADMVASLGVIAAALITWKTAWPYADPLVSVAIGLFILPRTLHLLKEAVGILLEGTPSHINPTRVRDTLASVPGVVSVHDLHVWTLTSKVHLLTVHVVIDDATHSFAILSALQQKIYKEFKIHHATIQIEPPNAEACLLDKTEGARCASATH